MTESQAETEKWHTPKTGTSWIITVGAEEILCVAVMGLVRPYFRAVHYNRQFLCDSTRITAGREVTR